MLDFSVIPARANGTCDAHHNDIVLSASRRKAAGECKTPVTYSVCRNLIP